MFLHKDNEKEQRLMALYIHTCLIIATLSLGTIGYFKYLDGTIINRVVSFDSQFLKTTQDVYAPGDKVEAIISLCKYRDLTPEVRYALVDTYLRFYPSRPGGLIAVGCYKDKVIRLEPIPADAYSGEYYFVGEVVYKINRFRTLKYTLRTNKFQVLTEE